MGSSKPLRVGPSTDLIDRLNQEATLLTREDPAKALELSRQALQQALALGYTQGCAEAYRLQGDALFFLSNFPDSLHSLLEAKTLYSRLGDLAGVARCWLGIGRAHEVQSECSEAMGYVRNALAIFRDLGNRLGEADALFALANVHLMMSDYAGAFEHYLNCLYIFRDLQDQIGESDTLQNIALCYCDMGDLEGAERAYLQALSLAQSTDNRSGEAVILGNLGTVYFRQSRYPQALESLELAHAILQDLSDRYGLGAVARTKALVLNALGQDTQALPLAKEGLAIAEQIGDRQGSAEAHLALGNIAFTLGHLNQAKHHLEQAYASAQDKRFRVLERDVLESLLALYEMQGDLPAALWASKQLRVTEKSLHGDESNQRLKSLMIEHAIEHSRKEAERERQRNQVLEAANREKATLVSQLKAQAKRLERQTLEDSLTGLFNRRYLENYLSEAFAQAWQNGQPLSIAVADIDYFKPINDTYSHQVGDQVLQTVAAVFRRVCRATDIIARYGGEEFVLVFPRTSLAAAQAICERLRSAIQDHPWHELHPKLRVTISFGLTDDLTVANHEKMLAEADAKLYQAKRNGRNQVCV